MQSEEAIHTLNMWHSCRLVALHRSFNSICIIITIWSLPFGLSLLPFLGWRCLEKRIEAAEDGVRVVLYFRCCPMGGVVEIGTIV